MLPKALVPAKVQRMTVLLTCVVSGVAATVLAGRAHAAKERFQEMVKQLPRSANAVVILNVEKAKNSPMGVREGWKAKVEKVFEGGADPSAAPGHAFRARGGTGGRVFERWPPASTRSGMRSSRPRRMSAAR